MGLTLEEIERSEHDAGRDAKRVLQIGALVAEDYDEIDLGYTGDNLTSVVYKDGGSTVATLTLGYTGDKLTSVVRS